MLQKRVQILKNSVSWEGLESIIMHGVLADFSEMTVSYDVHIQFAEMAILYNMQFYLKLLNQNQLL